MGLERLLAPGARGDRSMFRQIRGDDRRQPAAEVVDLVGVGTAEPQPRLLHRVVGLAQRAEHPVARPLAGGHGAPRTLGQARLSSIVTFLRRVGVIPHDRRDVGDVTQEQTAMEPRMNHPAFVVPGAMEALQAPEQGRRTRPASPRRPSSSCTCGPARSTAAACASTCTLATCSKAGESDERIFAVAAWREAPYYTDAERAALALAEAMTRLSRPARSCARRGLGRGRRATTTSRRWRR